MSSDGDGRFLTKSRFPLSQVGRYVATSQAITSLAIDKIREIRQHVRNVLYFRESVCTHGQHNNSCPSEVRML
jgi:hypothetical protein